jgi:hypothetical protein
MKKILFLGLLFSYITCNAQKSSNQAKIDSVFKYHYNILYKIANLQTNETITFDSPISTQKSMLFFEMLTNIKAVTDGSAFGKSYPSKEDLEKWMNWYNLNKNKLKWDEIEKIFSATSH